MTRLATVVAAVGAVTALGAATALAGPTATWSGPSRPIPGAITNTSPSVSSITFPNPIGTGTVVAWRGRSQNEHIYYKFRTPRTGHWSKLGVIPLAATNSAPAVRIYAGGTDPIGRPAVVAFWTGPFNHHIFYSEGETHANGTINWTKPVALPKTVAFTGSNDGPSVIFPNNNNVVVVAWRAPFNHVRFSVGKPVGRHFRFSGSHVVPNPPTTSKAHCVVAPCTSATPSLAEVQTSFNTRTGTLYVVWKQLGSNDLFYSTASDTPAAHFIPSFSVPTQVPGALTTVAPAASATHLAGPLLLVYKAPFSTHIKFQTLTGTMWSTPALVPTAFSAVGPALRGGTMATTTPTTVGSIILHFFR